MVTPRTMAFAINNAFATKTPSKSTGINISDETIERLQSVARADAAKNVWKGGADGDYVKIRDELRSTMPPDRGAVRKIFSPVLFSIPSNSVNWIFPFHKASGYNARMQSGHAEIFDAHGNEILRYSSATGWVEIWSPAEMALDKVLGAIYLEEWRNAKSELTNVSTSLTANYSSQAEFCDASIATFSTGA